MAGQRFNVSLLRYCGTIELNESSSELPRYVALKVLTADSYGGPKSVYELEILKHISQTDLENPGYRHVVHLLDSFVIKAQMENIYV